MQDPKRRGSVSPVYQMYVPDTAAKSMSQVAPNPRRLMKLTMPDTLIIPNMSLLFGLHGFRRSENERYRREHRCFLINPLFGDVSQPPFFATKIKLPKEDTMSLLPLPNNRRPSETSDIANQRFDPNLPLFLTQPDDGESVSGEPCITPVHYCAQSFPIEVESDREEIKSDREHVQGENQATPDTCMDARPDRTSKWQSLSAECNYVLSFGQFKGRRFGDIAQNETAYCNHLLSHTKPNTNVTKYCKYLIKVRGYTSTELASSLAISPAPGVSYQKWLDHELDFASLNKGKAKTRSNKRKTAPVAPSAAPAASDGLPAWAILTQPSSQKTAPASATAASAASSSPPAGTIHGAMGQTLGTMVGTSFYRGTPTGPAGLASGVPVITPSKRSSKKAKREKIHTMVGSEFRSDSGSDTNEEIEIVKVAKDDADARFSAGLKKCANATDLMKAPNPRLTLALQGLFDGPVTVTTKRDEELVRRANERRLTELYKKPIQVIKDFDTTGADDDFCEVVEPVAASIPTLPTFQLRPVGRMPAASAPTLASEQSPTHFSRAPDSLALTAQFLDCPRGVPKEIFPGYVLAEIWEHMQNMPPDADWQASGEVRDALALMQDTFSKTGFSVHTHGLDTRAADVRLVAQKNFAIADDNMSSLTHSVRIAWANTLKGFEKGDQVKFGVYLQNLMFLLSKVPDGGGLFDV